MINIKIGIAAPVTVSEFREFLPNLSETDLRLGLGGTAINIIIKSLLNKGYKVSVYTLDSNVKDNKVFHGDKLSIYIGRYRPQPKLRMINLFFNEWKQIKNFILNDKPDIVNAHWSYEFAIAAIKSKIPHLITFRDDAHTVLKYDLCLYRFSRFLMDLWVRKFAKNISVNSIYLKSKIKTKDIIYILPNPYQNSKLSAPNHKFISNEINIVTINNSWDKIKNPEVGLIAFQKLRRNSIKKLKYHLIGKDYFIGSKGYKWAKKNHLIEGVKFHGYLNYDDLQSKLDDFDILLHTSREESFGNVLIEAMSKGIPVVGGKNSGAVPWVLNYGEAGLLVDINSPDAVEKALSNLIDDEKEYERLSKNGFLNIKNRFSEDTVSNMYLNTFKEILRNVKK